MLPLVFITKGQNGISGLLFVIHLQMQMMDGERELNAIRWTT